MYVCMYINVCILYIYTFFVAYNCIYLCEWNVAGASNGKRPPCNGGARPSGVGTDMLRIICSQLIPQYTTELADFQFFRDLQGVFARSDASDSCSTFWVCRGSFLQTFRY